MIIKLANKLTKLFNGLKPETQELAERFLRSEKTFVSGIEKGNNGLLNKLRQAHKVELPVVSTPSNKHGGSFNTATKVINVNEVSGEKLESAIQKRHEILEAEQALPGNRRDNIFHKYFGHENENVIVKEHRLMANTPFSHNTTLYNYRTAPEQIFGPSESGYLSRRFGIDYGVNK